jgi:hypothetical protein
MRLEEGSRLDLLLEYSDCGYPTRLRLSRTVRRVGRGKPGTAVGVAIGFDERHDGIQYRRAFA